MIKKQEERKNKMKITDTIKINDVMTAAELDDLILEAYDYNWFEDDWETNLFYEGNVAVYIDEYNDILYSFEIVERAEENMDTVIRITNIEEI